MIAAHEATAYGRGRREALPFRRRDLCRADGVSHAVDAGKVGAMVLPLSGRTLHLETPRPTCVGRPPWKGGGHTWGAPLPSPREGGGLWPAGFVLSSWWSRLCVRRFRVTPPSGGRPKPRPTAVVVYFCRADGVSHAVDAGKVGAMVCRSRAVLCILKPPDPPAWVVPLGKGAVTPGVPPSRPPVRGEAFGLQVSSFRHGGHASAFGASGSRPPRGGRPKPRPTAVVVTRAHRAGRSPAFPRSSRTRPAS